MREVLVHGIKMQRNLQTKAVTFEIFHKLSYNHDSSKCSFLSHTEILSIALLTVKSFIQHKTILAEFE